MSRAQRMSSLLSDCFLAVDQAEKKSGHLLDGAERQDLVATLYINEYKIEEMDRSWPAKALPKIKAHLIPVDANNQPIDIGPNEPFTKEAAEYVAQNKIHKLQRGATVPVIPTPDSTTGGQRDTGDDPLNKSQKGGATESQEERWRPSEQSRAAAPTLDQQLSDTLKLLKSCPWKTSRQRDRLFAEIRERLGETVYLEQLDKQGVPSPALIHPREQQAAFYRSLLFLANRQRPHDDPPTGRAA